MHEKDNIFTTFKNLQKPLILDGAMGSLLTSSGVDWDINLWSSYANISHPNLVRDLHKKYINAGADIITTNTFRTNPLAYKNADIDLSLEHFVRRSVEIALLAKGGENVIIAASNAPAEDCYQADRTISLQELDYNHKKHIELLFKSGADLILNETQGHLDEIEIICKFCSENKIPYIISLFFTKQGKLLSGEPISEIVEIVSSYNPLAIGFNCVFFDTFSNIVNEISLNFSWGIYLNCGTGKLTDKQITCGVSPVDYSSNIKSFLNEKTTFVGSCCGSSPEHTKLIRELIDEIY